MTEKEGEGGHTCQSHLFATLLGVRKSLTLEETNKERKYPRH